MKRGKLYLRLLESGRLARFRHPLRRLRARFSIYSVPPVYQHRARDGYRLRPLHKPERRE